LFTTYTHISRRPAYITSYPLHQALNIKYFGPTKPSNYLLKVSKELPENLPVNMSADSLPVGTVIAYPVDVIDSEFSAYWQVCQGAPMNKTEYPELFDAIGYCNGSSSDPNIFFLPNLQGCFLRGADDSGSVDVQKDKRTSALTGQPASVLPGSIQNCATAQPRNLKLSVPYLPQGYHWINTGDSGPLAYMMMEWNGGYVDHTVRFPNAESVPVNTYMQYIIKVKPTVATPVGAIVPYGGSADQAPVQEDGLWAPCTGAQERTKSNAFAKLYKLLGKRYGLSPDGANFILPDLQGMFIRGVDVNTGRDRNGNRTQPTGLRGTSGPFAGSTQPFGTAQANNPLIARLWHEGTGATNEVFEIAGYYNVRGDNPSNTQYWSGGDMETRPINANVQFLISMNSRQANSDISPVGTIIAIPGNGALNPAYWVLCDGSSVLRSKYPQLFTAFQQPLTGLTVWGEADADHFFLPDLRGKFLRGVDNAAAGTAGTDPDRLHRRSPQPKSGSNIGTGSLQDCATSLNGVSIDLALPTRHWMNAATATGDKAEDWTDYSADCPILGGDPETRPINMAVNFYIKCAALGSF
jgi:microcystin-dependent protein